VELEDIRKLVEDSFHMGLARFYPQDFLTYLFEGYEDLFLAYQKIVKEREDQRLSRRKAAAIKRKENKVSYNRKYNAKSKGIDPDRSRADLLKEFVRGDSNHTIEKVIETHFTPTTMRGLFFEANLEVDSHWFYSDLNQRVKSLIKLIDTTFKGFIKSKAIQKTSGYEYALTMLLSYVSVYLPSFFQNRDGSLEKFPTNFNTFTCAYYVANNEYIASLINKGEKTPLTFFKYMEILGNHFAWSWNDTAYVHLKTIESYFQYIQNHRNTIPHSDKFECTISESDLPKTRRRITTAKNVLPREYFRTFISLLETLDYFVDHINGMADEENPGVIGGRLAFPTYSELVHHHAWSSIWGQPGMAKADIDVNCLNYTPVVLHEGSYFPLRRIKRFYALTPYRINGVDEQRAAPHTPRIMWLMANTGIRQKHLLWLNADEFDSAVTSNIPGLAPLIVSTDKAHSEWVSIVSGHVIETCRRQKEWLKKNEIEILKEPMWYSENEKNRFGKFIPLFRLDASSSTWGIWEDSAKIMWALDRFLRIEVGDENIPELAYWQPTKKALVPGSLEEHRKTLDGFSREDVDLSWDWKLRSVYTPHGLRAAFVSDHIRFLPPSLIGRHLTGQFSQALVWYYAVMDGEDIGDHQQLLINLLMKNEDAIRGGGAPELSQKIIEINANLAKDIDEDPDSAIATHGLFSLSDISESDNGIAALKAKKHTQLAYNATHICPFDNTCPAEVIKNFGLDKPCTLCPYAIRGAMHLPAINAEKFKYMEMMQEYGEKIRDYKKRPSTAVIKADIEELESQYDLLIRDAFALEAIEQQLYHLRDSRTDSLMAEDSDTVKNLYADLNLSESEHLIKRLIDVQCFPHLDSPSLQRRFAHMRLKLQMADGDIAGVLKSHKEPEYALLTSQILSMMAGKGLSVKEVFKLASSDLPNRMDAQSKVEILGFDKLVGREADEGE
jgi:hypothetical protein